MDEDFMDITVDYVEYRKMCVDEVEDLLDETSQEGITEVSKFLDQYIQKTKNYDVDSIFAAMVSACCAIAATRFKGREASLVIMMRIIFEQMEQQGVLDGGRTVN